jgi:hypothetical protein
LLQALRLGRLRPRRLLGAGSDDRLRDGDRQRRRDGAPATAAGTTQKAPKAGNRWEYNRASNVMFEVPASWTAKPTGQVLVISPPDGGVGIEFVAVQGGAEAKADEASMLMTVGAIVKNAKVLPQTAAKVNQNGLNGFGFDGTGSMDGKPIEWFSIVLGDGAGHGLLALGFAGVGQLGAHRAALKMIFDSIQPIS